MHSSQCLNIQHDKCDVKACTCICHDIVCPTCNGYRYTNERLPGTKKGACKVHMTCLKCWGRGRLPRHYDEKVVKFEGDPQCPF